MLHIVKYVLLGYAGIAAAKQSLLFALGQAGKRLVDPSIDRRNVRSVKQTAKQHDATANLRAYAGQSKQPRSEFVVTEQCKVCRVNLR